MLDVIKGIENFLVNYGYTVEMVFAIAVFAMYLEKKKQFLLRSLGSYAVMAVCYMQLCRMMRGRGVAEELILYALINIVIYLALKVCFQASWWSLLFVMIASNTVQHITYRIYSAILSFLGYGYDSFVAGILNLCVSAVVYTLVYLFFRSQLHDIEECTYNNRTNLFLGLAVFVLVLIVYRFEEQYDFFATNPGVNLLFSIYMVAADIFLLALLYGVFQSRKMTGEMEQLEEVIRRQEQQYELMKENIDIVNIKCHDMKQQISMFENRIDREALSEIKSIINVYDTTFKTGSEVLDIFLQEKMLRCEKSEIKLDCIVDGKCVEFIRPADLYTLVGNAIDNAMEAVKKIENPEERMISLQIRKSMNLVLLHVDNKYTGEIRMKDGIPKSTKGDDVNHGFGMWSMRLIAEKYRGTLTVAVEQGIFNLNVVIPVPAERTGTI